MKIAGFTIIRNALKFDYPVEEAILSILPICDVFYVGVGNSEDGTRALIEKLDPTKIRIIDTVWNDALREGGLVLSEETNKVFDQIPTEFDWCFYIQSDECVHENDHKKILEAAKDHLNKKEVDGLLFGYKHFYGQYNYIGAGRRWYANEIRIIRNNKNIRSYKDAQGFRMRDGNKLKVKETNAFIYHYGWVKPPQAQQAKQENFHKMWHDDNWMKNNIKIADEFDYSKIDLLEKYQGSHPAIMQKRIAGAKWNFIYDPAKAVISLKYRFLYFVEKISGWRIGENRNYKKI